uniref:Uncharacterized protein n=1 Tax=Anguilla anguilla TaxID=7936 RepID=A0A0E9TLJ6_ANGAN
MHGCSLNDSGGLYSVENVCRFWMLPFSLLFR